MRRHPFDVVSLVAGLLFTILAAGYIVTCYYDVDLPPRLVFPLVLVTLGVGGLVGSVLAQRRSDDSVHRADQSSSV